LTSLALVHQIADVKEKFRTHIGTSVDHQRLILKSDGVTIREMGDNSKMLGFYSVVSGMEIHVIDTDPFSLSRGGGLTDVSLIQKYKMEDEVYEKRAGTMREFIREQRKKDPNFKLKPKMGPGTEGAAKNSSADNDVIATNQPAPGVESVAGMEVGMRCEVTPGARRGVVMFIGEIPEIKAGGYWVRL
jgi:tubulin-specific chaperone B